MTSMTKMQYTPPEADLSLLACRYVLATSYNGDDYTDYIDYEDGGLI